jgi:predicted secreted protein
MNPLGAAIIFVLIWWLVFFAVLPWGVRGRWEKPDDGVAGAEPGAPVAPDLRRKALVTTGIALALTLVAVAAIAGGLFRPPG